MGMTEDDKRNCCLLEIQETEAKYYKTLEEIEKVSEGLSERSAFPGRTGSASGLLCLWREDSHRLPADSWSGVAF